MQGVGTAVGNLDTVEFLYFNTRGLNNPIKQSEVYKTITQSRCDVIILTETKLTTRFGFHNWPSIQTKMIRNGGLWIASRPRLGGQNIKYLSNAIAWQILNTQLG
jgi:hypothetical protein